MFKDFARVSFNSFPKVVFVLSWFSKGFCQV